jgi:hypothetical protein
VVPTRLRISEKVHNLIKSENPGGAVVWGKGVLSCVICLLFVYDLQSAELIIV